MKKPSREIDWKMTGIVSGATVVGGLLLLAALWEFKPEPPKTPPVKMHPAVITHEVKKSNITLTVAAQGSVQPRTETSIVAEVSGKVVEVAPSLQAGGFFEKGDLLLLIDPRDYEVAVIQAKAQVAAADANLARENALAEQAIKDWKRLQEGSPPPLAARKPQLAEAEATLASAKASLQKAENDLARTQIKAPYAGRVRSKMVDIGQFVNNGAQLAMIYAIDYVEVRLPLSDEEISRLSIPVQYRGEGMIENGPIVTLFADFAGARHEWKGRIVRTEGEVDIRSRLYYAIARVDNPYGRSLERNLYERPPLSIGMFVSAVVEGRKLDNVFAVPPTAVHDGKVHVIDGENRLRMREVKVVSNTREHVIIQTGLTHGEKVSITQLNFAIDGMEVSPRHTDPVSNRKSGEMLADQSRVTN